MELFSLLLLLAALFLIVLNIVERRSRMAQVTDLETSIAALTTAVNALVTAFQTKASGIDPATLDPVKASLDSLTATVNQVVNPQP